MTMERRRWRKASASANTSDCVEVANMLDAVRDSKNVAGPMLRADLGALVRAVKAGQLDR
jgi:hypothetical protein